MRIVNPHIIEDDVGDMGYAVGHIQGTALIGLTEAWRHAGDWHWHRQDPDILLSKRMARDLAAALLAAADEAAEVGS